MIAALLITAIIAGLDNLQAGAALGLLPIPRHRLVLYALAFAVAETVAPLLGMLCSRLLFAPFLLDLPYLGPGMLIGCGAFLLALHFRRRDVAILAGRPELAIALAVSLSYDNFLLGLGLGSAGFAVIPAVVATGTICAAMSCIGLFGTSGLRRWLPRGSSVAASLALCMLGAHGLVFG